MGNLIKKGQFGPKQRCNGQMKGWVKFWLNG